MKNNIFENPWAWSCLSTGRISFPLNKLIFIPPYLHLFTSVTFYAIILKLEYLTKSCIRINFREPEAPTRMEPEKPGILHRVSSQYATDKQTVQLCCTVELYVCSSYVISQHLKSTLEHVEHKYCGKIQYYKSNNLYKEHNNNVTCTD